MTNDTAKKAEDLQSLKRGTGIKHMLYEVSKILGNPVLINDTSYNLLAYTEMTVKDDVLWNELIANGTFSDETVKFFSDENFIKLFDQSDVTTLMKSSQLKYDRINGKLFDKDNIQLGNLLVLGCYKPFEEGDEELIELACDILSVELQNSETYHKINKVYQESIISKIIDGTIKDDKIMNTALLELYENLKSNIYVAAVDVTECENTLSHLGYYRDLFKKIQPEYRYYDYLNNILILFSTDEAIFDPKTDMKKLNEYFSKNNIYAGVSSRFQDLKELKKHYREAVNALNYGIKSKNKQNIFNYEDYRLEHFLQSLCSVGDIRNIYNSTFFLIKDYDKENKSTLINTLYCYLCNGLNKDLTSEAAGIKIEELTKQLDLLKKHFKIDWNNGETLFSFFVTMKLINNIE